MTVAPHSIRPPAQWQISPKDMAAAVQSVVAVHGAEHTAAISAGVARVAARWQESDGDAADMAKLCCAFWVNSAQDRVRLLGRLETALEQIGGHLYEMRRSLRRWNDLAGDDFPGVDDALATFDPAPDLSDQFYRQKLAFIALLNFDRPDLQVMLRCGESWSIDEWAAVRVAQQFGPRIPASLADHARQVGHRAQDFVNRFHVPVGTMIDAKGRRWFEPDRALLAHWLVREEIKAGYGDPDGLHKQRALMWVMARHIDGTVPTAVMERTSTEDWDPHLNTVGGRPVGTAVNGPVRYQHWLAQRELAGQFDVHYPEAPTAIARKFDLHREIPESHVERLLTELLEHPVRRRMAAFLRARLQRPLEPHDIYFDDVGTSTPAAELNALVRKQFADEREFEHKLPQVLRVLGFSADDAEFFGRRIKVEIAKGSGHAMRPLLTQYGAWLRTNRLKDELGWDGFDTAMHELGHNLEQICSTYLAPRPALRNVPNTACTEAFAFLYQGLARRVLGVHDATGAQAAQDTDAVATMLAACQIAGPSLVELYAWRWLYANPSATPDELRAAVLTIASDVWVRHYQQDFGNDSYGVLAAYQHMIAHPLYLADYTLGHIISHQIRAHMRGKDLAHETKRICSLGRFTPELWMKRAVGQGISVQPLASETDAALQRMGH